MSYIEIPNNFITEYKETSSVFFNQMKSFKSYLLKNKSNILKIIAMISLKFNSIERLPMSKCSTSHI